MGETKSTIGVNIWKILCLATLLGVIALAGLGAYKLLEAPSFDPLYSEYPPGYTPTAAPPAPRPDAPRPNIVIILCDDLGYGDVGCYGTEVIKTPNIDRLARQGVRFTSFYASNSVCTPSRAGLLTGRYSQRSGMTWILLPEDEPAGYRATKNFGQMMGRLGFVDLGPNAGTTGLPQSEITLAEALKTAGYRTGMVGKWHLGDYGANPDHNPVRHGFDFYFGVPHSNDMVPFPLYRNEQELEANIEDQAKLTGLYTKEAVSFIEESREKPFFLYFAHTFPHQPLFASERFRGRSAGGIYGDAVEEIDWSVGQIMDCLERNGLEQSTVVFFTSDNGPWFEGDPAGHRGRKGQSYEGGFRVPMIARYPNVIPAGRVCGQPAMNIDFFPTSLALAGVELPRNRIIDGRDILGLMTGESEETPHEAFYFYHVDELEAIRMGKWKYIRNIHHYVWPVPVDKPTTPMGKLARGRLGNWPMLYDLAIDPRESYNLIDNYPEVGQRLAGSMAAWEADLELNPRGWITP
jgi:arylsulfatase A